METTNNRIERKGIVLEMEMVLEVVISRRLNRMVNQIK